MSSKETKLIDGDWIDGNETVHTSDYNGDEHRRRQGNVTAPSSAIET